ncbi:hypothetical protein ACFLTQ_01575 [Chloroflexota bacterium]
MKLRILIAAALLFTIVNTNIGSSCSTGEAGGGNFIELLKWAPRDSTSFTFWDIEALGDGDGFHIWQDWQDKEEEWLEDMGGIETYEVRYFSQALVPDLGVLTIVTGDFILEEIEQNLKSDEYNPQPYKNVTLLVKTVDDKEIAVASYKGIITGDKELVKKCIDVIKGEENSPSLYEDASIKKIADKLPGGVMTGIMRDMDEQNEGGKEFYPYLVGLGMSVEEKNEETFKVKAAYKFEVGGAAESEANLAAIENNLTEMDFAAIKCECFEPEVNTEEDFIKAEALMNINDFSYFNLA